MPRYSVANNEHCCFCVLDFDHCVPELNHHLASRDLWMGVLPSQLSEAREGAAEVGKACGG